MMELFKVNAQNYNDVFSQDHINNELITEIQINGAYSEEKDLPVYREVSLRCSQYVTKLTLKFVKLQVNAEQIATFPNLKELDLGSGELSFGFLNFNEWCPNLETLNIRNIEFKEGPEDDWISLAEEHPSPLLRSLTMDMNIDSKVDVYFYFEAMEKQFPMLENLYLEFETGTNFTLNKSVPCFGGSRSSTYEPLYFENLKKLSVFAFVECDDIFNYLSISNKQMKEIHFMGMSADRTLITSICNYPNLTKLNLDCPYVYENELSVLCTGLPKLMTLVLDTKYFHWKASDMMDFIQKSKSLRHLKIDVDRNGKNFDIDEVFKKQFEALIENGRKFLTLDMKCFGSLQEIQLSRKGAYERPPSPSSSLDESDGWF